MNKILSIIIGVILVLGIGTFVYYQTKDAPAPAQESSETETSEETGSNTQMSEGITLAEVANHSDKASCWSVINGNVYDLTSWVPKHPGGEGAILVICGKDGSEKFNGQHGGAAMQAQILVGFKIGVLAQ
jgi:cytochrome b involved in lipid metabolism